VTIAIAASRTLDQPLVAVDVHEKAAIWRTSVLSSLRPITAFDLPFDSLGNVVV